MTKLLTPAELKSARDADVARDRSRIDATKKALGTLETQLNDAEAKFQMTLANQGVKWAKAEEEAMHRIDALKREIADLEKQREALRIPMADEEKRAHDLFKQAEDVYAQATKTKQEAEALKLGNDITSEMLTSRLDDLTGREVDLLHRQEKLDVREQGLSMERENIKKLSQELSIKLNSL